SNPASVRYDLRSVVAIFASIDLGLDLNDRVGQGVSNEVNFLFGDREGRCQQNVIAGKPICGAVARIDGKAGFKCLSADPGGNLQFWVERRFLRAVAYEFDAREQALPTNIADPGRTLRHLAEPVEQ